MKNLSSLVVTNDDKVDSMKIPCFHGQFKFRLANLQMFSMFSDVHRASHPKESQYPKRRVLDKLDMKPFICILCHIVLCAFVISCLLQLFPLSFAVCCWKLPSNVRSGSFYHIARSASSYHLSCVVSNTAKIRHVALTANSSVDQVPANSINSYPIFKWVAVTR